MPQTQKSREISVPICDEAINIGSLSEFRRLISSIPTGFAIDYIGQFSVSAILMFHLLKRNGFKLIVIDSGAFPLPIQWRQIKFSLSGITYAVRSRLLKRATNKIVRLCLLRILPDQTPDLALVAGTSWQVDQRFNNADIKIASHSFDYEKYRQVNASGPLNDHSEYAVYIDERLPAHEDNSELGLNAPVSLERFSSSIKMFFDQFEAESGMPVRIASYPSSSCDHDQHFQYGDRKIVRGKTAELVRGASLVFAHASTSVSFAILWRRPLVFLSSNELQESWYMPWVTAMTRFLESPLVNIDDHLSGSAVAQFKSDINLANYEEYEANYLRSSTACDVSIWQLLSQGIDECLSKS